MSQLRAQPDARPPVGDADRHAEAPPVLATPSDVPGPYEPRIPFWLPDWSQSLKLLGWRWILVVGLAALAVVLLWFIFFRSSLLVLGLSAAIIKLAAFIVASAISLAMFLRKGVVRHRKDPFCIHCGYSLTGLADGVKCPECGRVSNFRLAEEYKRDPHWFIKRHRDDARFAPTGATLDVPRSATPSRPPSP